jgi:hypothetical protein
MGKIWVVAEEQDCWAAWCRNLTVTECEACRTAFCNDHHELHGKEPCGYCGIDVCEFDATEIVRDDLELCSSCASSYRLGRKDLATWLMDIHSEDLNQPIKETLNDLIASPDTTTQA